jgi:hypothetical protein
MLVRRRSPVLLRSLLFAIVAGSAGPAAAASITGVCPDGSIFVVQRAEVIPCRGAKRIDADEVPPMRPEYLPRPYTWQVYNEEANPNNAYNLVDQARQVRALRDGKLPPISAGEQPQAQRDTASRSQASTERKERPAAGPLDLGLSEGELRDLYFIIELSQQSAPAAFAKDSARGDELLVVSLANSPAFEERFAEAWRKHGKPLGPVLLFSAIARAEEPFFANFTFSQGPLAFQPRVDDPMQFGVLQGRLGPMPRNTAVLGYVVLPDTLDPEAPMDIYWNDRRIESTLSPLPPPAPAPQMTQ